MKLHLENTLALVTGSTAGIGKAIARTPNFFESVGVPTRMSAYNLEPDTIPIIVNRLKSRGIVALGERQDIDLKLCGKSSHSALSQSS
jgi:NADP-dependent alcohol dehydrogenase